MTNKAKRNTRRATHNTPNRNITLGELVAAAFDAVGTEVRDVAKVLTSSQLSSALQRRIVLV